MRSKRVSHQHAASFLARTSGGRRRGTPDRDAARRRKRAVGLRAWGRRVGRAGRCAFGAAAGRSMRGRRAGCRRQGGSNAQCRGRLCDRSSRRGSGRRRRKVGRRRKRWPVVGSRRGSHGDGGTHGGRRRFSGSPRRGDGRCGSRRGRCARLEGRPGRPARQTQKADESKGGRRRGAGRPRKLACWSVVRQRGATEKLVGLLSLYYVPRLVPQRHHNHKSAAVNRPCRGFAAGASACSVRRQQDIRQNATTTAPWAGPRRAVVVRPSLEARNALRRRVPCWDRDERTRA